MRAETITNNMGRRILVPSACYHLDPILEGNERYTGFSVEPDKRLPIHNINPDSFSKDQVIALHQFNLFTSLAAITSSQVMGMRSDASAYFLEYSTEYDNHFDQKIYLALIDNALHGAKLKILEIGGQQGKYLDTKLTQLKNDGYSATGTIIDLDLSRRANYTQVDHPTTNDIKFIQADAHHLKGLFHEKLFERPNRILLHNVTDVIFDPFEVLAQAWDILQKNGVIIIGDSTRTKDLPFTPLLNGKPAIYYDNWAADNNEHALINNLTTDFQKVKNAIPKKSQVLKLTDQTSSEFIALSHAMHALPILIQRFSLTETLVSLGYEAYTIVGKDRGRVCVVRKSGDSNPFRHFIGRSVSKPDFHAGEYDIVQMHRTVNVPTQIGFTE